MAEHAKLSASSAERWMVCTPSVVFSESFENRSSVYADEGTLAHSLAENLLAAALFGDWRVDELAKIKQHPMYSAEMEDYINGYVDRVLEIVNEYRANDPATQVYLEQRLSLVAYIPEGFGTSDVVIVSRDTVHIIDLKYGKGVKKDAPGNPQMRVYALGAVALFDDICDIKLVRATIIQPRLDWESTEELPRTELEQWGDKELAPKAQLAYAGKGEFCAGDHCKFCPGRDRCEARADSFLKLVDFGYREPNTLSNEDLATILPVAEALKEWADGVALYVLNQMLAGETFPGWKVVEGRSVRKYTDPQQVMSTLAGEQVEGYLKPPEPKGITDMEKLLGKKKFNSLLGGLVHKPRGKPTLAPEADPREAYRSDTAIMAALNSAEGEE